MIGLSSGGAGLMIAIYAAAVAQAPEIVTIVGRVTTASGEPAPGSLVAVESLGIRTSTGANGSYVLMLPAPRLTAGQPMILRVSLPGYSDASRAISLAPSTTSTHDFMLAPAALSADGLVVTGAGPATASQGAPRANRSEQAPGVRFDFSNFAFGNRNLVAGRCLLTSANLAGLPALDGPCFMSREGRRITYSIGDYQCTVDIDPSGAQAAMRVYAYRGRCPINVGQDALLEDDVAVTGMRRIGDCWVRGGTRFCWKRD